MNNVPQWRNDAVQLAKQAVEKEDEKKYDEAMKLYKKAIYYLKMIYEQDENKYSRETYIQKIEEYEERACYLQKYTESLEKIKNKEVVGGGKDKEDESEKLREMLETCVVTDKPNVNWEDICGLEKAKEALKEAVILPIKFPHFFQGNRIPWKGILLYGPPGTGKSFLAKACATEVEGTFYSVSASNIVSKYQGEAEKTVRALFDLARQHKPAVIFLDEIDSLLTARGDNENEASRRVKTEFLVQMQGVGKDDRGILVLGATNIPWELDFAVNRRFQKKIYIPLPDKQARLNMFKLNLGKTIKHTLTENDFKDLSEMTDGYSGSDIATLTQDAIYEPLRKCQQSKFFRIIQGTHFLPCSPSDEGAKRVNLMDIDPPELLEAPDVVRDDFIKALSKIRPTVSIHDLIRQEQFTQEFGQEG